METVICSAFLIILSIMVKKVRKQQNKRRGKISKTFGEKYVGRKFSQDEKRYIIYVVLALLLLVLFAIEPGFFLGLIIGALGYRYYIDNIK